MILLISRAHNNVHTQFMIKYCFSTNSKDQLIYKKASETIEKLAQKDIKKMGKLEISALENAFLERALVSKRLFPNEEIAMPNDPLEKTIDYQKAIKGIRK